MKTNKPDIIDNIRASILIAISIVLLIYAFYLMALLTIPKDIAYWKSREAKNIQIGCLYFLGSQRRGAIYKIDNYSARIEDLIIDKSPAYFKYKNNLNSNKNWNIRKNYCYKAKYVHVHFLNKDFSYVYDFIY